MAARDDILEKVKKSRQEAEQRIKESNKKAEADRQKSEEAYRKSTTRETQQAASYMKDYSSPSRAGNDIASYTEKRKKATRWYKGDAPTEAETIAYSVKVGQQDKEKGREIYNLYQQAKTDGHWAETYDKATSQYLTALGLTADQVNDDFFAANADLFDYGVTTAAGNLSTAKRNGPEALLAADLKGLYDDYQKTKALQAEQDQAMKEAKYWMAQGLADDEIKAKLDIGGANSKYKNLYKAIEKTATGEYEPTTAPIQLLTSYGVDGMLYALRNPDSSTGDYLLDAVQREMGRGVKGPEASDSRRDMTSASYAPYAVGMAGMDEYGIKYGRTSFDRDWLNSPEGLAVRNNPETTKDYAAIWEAVENTETYKAAVDEFNTDVRAMIEAGASPEEIFSSEMLDDYPEVKKLYEAQQKGMPLKTASAIDFDIGAMYDEADKAYKANVGKISSEAYDTDVSAKLGTPSTRTAATAGTQTQTAEQMRAARSIFAPYATPSELNVFKTIGPSYGDTKGAVLNGITNGTSGEDQAYLSAMDAADMYAAEFYLPSVQKMNSLNREKELFDKYEAFLAEWEPRLAKEGPGLMGTDEFKAAQAEIEAAEAVWDKYDGSPDELNAAIENEKKIQQNIDRKYGDAQMLNKNGITGLSVKPMLDFAAQFESFVPSRYADTEWGARMSKGESWDAVSKDMEKAKASNDQLLLMIDTTLKQAEKFGINKEYTAGLKRAQEALLEENQLIEFTSARGNEDYSSRIAEVDGMDLRQAVASADVNLLPDRIMMAVFSPDTLASKMTGNTIYEELALAPRMTEQEVNDYKYYLAESPEKAAEYYNALTPMLRVRAAQEMEEQAAEDVDTIGGAIGASIASILVNTAQGFMLPSMALKSASGEEIDPYSMEFLPSLYSQTARSEIKGNIKGAFGEGSWQEKALNFAYDAVMTGADSTAAAMVGKPFGVTGKIGKRAFEIAGGLMLQSSSAAMSTLMDVKMRGGTDAQAWEMAGITAAAEAASEYLPMENLSKMMDKGLKSGFKTELLKQIASDAPGEMLSELVGSVSDQVIMQELSNWEASYKQYAASGLSDEEARKQADLDVWKGIGYAGLLSVGTSTGSVALAAGIGKVKKTLFKSRAETVLSEATAKGASKADQTATVSAAMESMGVDPVEADAAAQAMASVDPNAAATVQSILVHTEDPAVVDAIRLGSMVPDSQTGQILSTIQQEGATDENVQALVETAQAENAVPEIQNQYETALTNSVEAMASVNAMLGSDNSNVAAAKEAVTQAEQNLKAQQQSIAEAESEMQAATSVLQNAKKRFNAKPADQKAKASVTKAIARYQQAQGHLEQVRATTDIAKAQEDLKAARAGLESARNEALTAARQAAQPIVQETMAQREQRQVEAEQTRIAEQEESNLLEMEFQNYLAEKAPNATPEQIEQLRADFFAVADELSTQGQQDTVQPDEKNVRFAETIGKRFNINVEFRDTKGLFKGAYQRGTNTIVLDSKLTQGEAIFEVALHELTHRAEQGGLAYNSYANSILDIAFGGDKKKIKAEIAARKERYNNRFAQMAMSGREDAAGSSLKPLSNVDAKRELVADLTRRVLYGDEQLISQLVESNPDAAYTFLDWVKDTLKRMVGIKGGEVDQLNRTRELFEKALAKAEKKTETSDLKTQYQLDDIDQQDAEYYNRYGWAGVHDVLNYQERSAFDSRLSDLKNGVTFDKNADGLYIFDVGKEFGVNNVVMISDGNFENPTVERVYRIHLDNETDIEYVRDTIHAAEKSYSKSSGIVQKDFGEGLVERYERSDFASYEELQRERGAREQGEGTDRENRQKWFRRGNVVVNLIDGDTQFSLPDDFALSDAETKTSTPAFKRWFGNSQVVNEDGSPKVMYRGGGEEINVFDRKKSKASNLYGRGFYFTDSETHAKQYGEARSYYLRIENPLSAESGAKNITRDQMRAFLEAVAEDEDYGLENYGYAASVDSVLKEMEGRSDFDALQDINATAVGDFVAAIELFNEVNGTNYDGIITPTETVVFDSKQIKSATNNVGTFDPSNPDIRFSLSDDSDVRREHIRAWRAARLTSGNELGEQTPQPQRPQGERQFVAQTMPNTEAVPEWIWREFQRNPDELNYDIDTNREQVERGWQRIQQEGYDNELNRLMDAERFSADDTAEANLMMAMALRNEDPGTFMALASKYNKEGTEAGKELQARKLFSKMTPTGARIWVAGKLEAGLGEFIRKHRPLKQQVDQRAQEIADEIRNLDSSDQVLRLMSGEETTIDSSNNRWGVPINQQQQALIDHYGLGNVARPGIYYNRATTKQRMLEAILATPNPLAITGNGLNLIQRLEFMSEGAAVITNADLNYIGSRLSEFVAYGAENGGREADVAVARAYEAFGNITPATRGEKARTWRYVAMLTSVPSAIRNIIGNASQNLVNAASHGIAVEIDKLLAGRTGQRTAAHLDIQERVQGWRSFVEESRNVFRDYFVDRVTTQRGEDKFNTHQRGRVYQTQAFEAVRNVEGFLMSFGDRNIWRKAYVNSIAEQQKLADQNLLFNDDGTTRTHEQILEQAEADANYATFSEDSQLSTIMGQLKRIPGIGAIVDFIMPFTGVPTNITRRMIQYSPAGIATAAYRAAVDHHRGENFDQHRFVNDLSRGLTGTAMMGLGVLLAEMGAIKLGTGEEEDKKKYALQTAMGQQYTPYILNPFTNEYVSLSVFSPAASAITMGAAAYNDFKENDSALQAIKSAAFGSFDQIFDASYMSSLSDLFSGQGSVGENLIDTVTSSAISQNVPAVLGQLANALDPYVRDTKDKSAIMQAFKSGVINKIPFLRNAVLPEKVDVTGQTVRTKEGIRNFFDPFTTTDRREDPAIDELFRLNESLGASNMLPSDALSGTKMTLTVSVKEGKKSKSKKVTVDAKGKETYRKRYGELWLEGGTTLDKSGKRNEVEGVRSLINSKAYQRMDDVERAEAIADILSEAKIGAGMEALNAFGPDEEEE